MKKKLIVLSGSVLSLAPVVALAVTSGGDSTCVSSPTGGTLFTLFCKITSILNAILPVLIALAVVLFVWGVVMYVIGNSEEAKKSGKDKMIYGIIGLAVIISLWGLVSILTKTFSLENVGSIGIPTVNF